MQDILYHQCNCIISSNRLFNSGKAGIYVSINSSSEILG
ncbi:MAG: hypothetical protein HUJ68_08835 [Clostridia bacterium]|nr:hypothetical protein [Clostridia bacterium]